MAGTISPIYDAEAEALKRQMAFANALRDKGMSNDIGGGYRGGRVFIVGNPLGNIASSIGGAILANRAEEGQRGLEQRMGQERQNWLNAVPQASTEKTVELEGPTETGDTLTGTTSVLKSAKQRAMENQAWAMQAPRGMEGVQQFALQQTLTAPQREEEARQRAEDRKEEQAIKLEQAAQLAKDRNALLQAQIEGNNAYKQATLGIQQQGLDIKKDAAQQKIDAATEKKNTQQDAYLGSLNRLEEIVNDLKAAPNLSAAVGAVEGRLPALVAFSPQEKSNAASKIKNLQEYLQTKGLEDLRRAGVAPGSVTEKEWSKFAARAGNIDPTLSEKEFGRELDNLLRDVNAARNKLVTGGGNGGKTVKRRVPLKDGRTGIEWSDGSRTIE
ncbi:MAG: hypothetical protein ABFC77_15675 [Thermoguttaceae bacterium]